MLTNTETADGESAGVTLIAGNTGPYYFRVFQVSSFCSGGTYRLVVSNPTTATPTSTRTPTPTGSPTATGSAATPIPGADRYEPNFDFDRATSIALNVKYTDLNFAPWAGSDPKAPDNDFFKVWVKPGLLVTCETLELGPGVDTNLILYDNNRNGIGGSQDVDRAVGNFASRLSYYVTYEGWLYILIGNEYPIDPPSLGVNYTYDLQCVVGPGPTSTPTNTRVPVPTVPTDTPTPSPIPTDTPTLTPTPPFIQVRALPTATPQGMLSVLVPINLTVYYDLNNDNQPDPGEGVVGISARVIDVTTGQELAHGFTDQFGFASLTVNASGVVRLVVPYLGQSFIIQTAGSSVLLRIAPHDLPTTIP
ncbi:MAG TPA: hypothetical protein VIK33_14120 [Anaerolineae bacterium]